MKKQIYQLANSIRNKSIFVFNGYLFGIKCFVSNRLYALNLYGFFKTPQIINFDYINCFTHL